MKEVDIDDFQREISCIFNGEQYSVRDNGAVLRHQRIGKRLRSIDNQWTFGKPDSQNGYMYIASIRAHRIVATAFHGEPPTPEHVVDHIDTNRRNNRPENLRWLTRLENALLNPFTVKRIVFHCGSIEAFLQDPSKLRHCTLNRNYAWMRTVSSQEAQACLERMHLLTKQNKPTPSSGSMGEWLYKPISSTNSPPKISERVPHLAEPTNISITQVFEPASSPNSFPEEHDLVMAKTIGAAQRNWRTPTEFPCCPQKVEKDPIATYAAKLTTGAIFSRNNFSEHAVLKSTKIEDDPSIYVMCEQTAKDAMKPWSLAKITFEKGLYVHANLSIFFTYEGAEKRFCFTCGLEWTGGDTVDDYC